jgi:acyl-coenzyme A thioesterase PaaI-like protein
MENMSESAQRDLDAMLEKVNEEDAFAKIVGMRVVELSPGYAKAIMDVTDDHVNLFQMAHGAAIFSVADHACEAAGNSFGEPVWKPQLGSFIGREGLASLRPWCGTNVRKSWPSVTRSSISRAPKPSILGRIP